jgi:hypothetical protein
MKTSEPKALQTMTAEDIRAVLKAERPEHNKPLPPLEPGTLWFDWVRRATYMNVDAVMSLHAATERDKDDWEEGVQNHDPLQHIQVRDTYNQVLGVYETLASLFLQMRPEKPKD